MGDDSTVIKYFLTTKDSNIILLFLHGISISCNEFIVYKIDTLLLIYTSSSWILAEIRKVSHNLNYVSSSLTKINKFKELTPFEHIPNCQNMSKNRYLFQGNGD